MKEAPPRDDRLDQVLETFEVKGANVLALGAAVSRVGGLRVGIVIHDPRVRPKMVNLDPEADDPDRQTVSLALRNVTPRAILDEALPRICQVYRWYCLRGFILIAPESLLTERTSPLLEDLDDFDCQGNPGQIATALGSVFLKDRVRYLDVGIGIRGPADESAEAFEEYVRRASEQTKNNGPYRIRCTVRKGTALDVLQQILEQKPYYIWTCKDNWISFWDIRRDSFRIPSINSVEGTRLMDQWIRDHEDLIKGWEKLK